MAKRGLEQAEQKHEKWQTAIEVLIMAAEGAWAANARADRGASGPEPERRARIQDR